MTTLPQSDPAAQVRALDRLAVRARARAPRLRPNTIGESDLVDGGARIDSADTTGAPDLTFACASGGSAVAAFALSPPRPPPAPGGWRSGVLEQRGRRAGSVRFDDESGRLRLGGSAIRLVRGPTAIDSGHPARTR